MKRIPAFVLALALTALTLTFLSGCAPVSDVAIPTMVEGQAYDQFYPYYIEAFAVTQIRPLTEEHGGNAGHAALYLKGVCRDTEASYPKIRICEEGEVDLADPEAGVGVSVNKMFRTANWIGVEGRNLFYEGGLQEGDRLNQETFNRALKEAVDRGIFRGVELHEQYLTSKPPEMEMATFIASQSIGTDFAMRFGRSVFAVRVPVTREMMVKAVDFLNEINAEYTEGEADYNWSGYNDNCSHLMRNTLAAAGVWAPKSVRSIKLKQFFNLSIPANEFADLAIYTKEFSLDSFFDVYNHPISRTSLLEHNWLPAQHGSLLQLIGVWPDNDLYDTQFRIFVLQNPFLRGHSKQVRAMLSDRKNVILSDNLRYWKARYAERLQTLPDKMPTSGSERYRQTARAFRDHLESQQAEVERILAQLSEPGE